MIEYLEKYLIKFNKAIFMVTHDRYFLERVTNKIIEIDRCLKYTNMKLITLNFLT